MLPSLQLPAYPSCKNCLAWSADGELAVAAGENVYIQIPRWRRPRRAQDPRAGLFTNICLQVNSFKFEEWPREEPLSFKECSLGEEQSLSTVVALAWSPPGLAKHKRSVLAVLTSNLRLSLWTSTSDPEYMRSWKRIIIINHALRTYFEPLLDLDTVQSKSTTTTFQRMTRIRSFAWTQPVRDATEDVTKLFENRWEVFFIAIANDNNQIALVRVKDGYTVIPSIKYRAEICCHFSCDTREPDPMNNEGTPTSFITEAADMATNRADEPNINTDWIYTALTKYMEYHSRFQQDSTSDHNQEFNTAHQDFEAPLRLDMVENHSLLKTSLNYRQYAEDVFISDWVSDDGLYVAIVGYVCKGDARHRLLTLRFEVSRGDTKLAILDDTSRIGVPNLVRYKQTLYPRNPSNQIYKKMLQCRANFDDEHNLGGLAVMRTWGLAWWHNIELVCITCHPGDMVEYTIPSKERCTLIFHDHNDEKNPAANTNPLDLLVKHNPVSSEKVTKAQEGIVKTILSYKRGTALTKLSAKIIYAGIRGSMILRHNQATKAIDLEITPPSAENAAPTQSVDPADPLLPTLHLLTTNPTTPQNLTNLLSNLHETTPSIHEICTICHQPLPFTNLSSDLCPNNHHFARCALTFLAITSPGISKYCTGCNRAFLNEEMLLDAKREDAIINDDVVTNTLHELANTCLGELNASSASTEEPQTNAPSNTMGTVPQTSPQNDPTEPMDIDQPSLQNTNTSTPIHASTEDSLPHHLYTTYPVCPYCHRKYVG